MFSLRISRAEWIMDWTSADAMQYIVSAGAASPGSIQLGEVRPE